MKKDKILFPKDPSNTEYPWLWIGTWSMGGEGFGPHDERESIRVLEKAFGGGIRHFDTAGFYAHGKSEQLLRKVSGTGRKEFFLSSKGGLTWDGHRVIHKGSPKELRSQLEESLDRLHTDYLDLYQLHWPDPEVPLDESVAALKEMRDEGLIRYWGVGNLDEIQVNALLSSERDIPHQVHFNPLHRSDDILATGKESCINCIISPLEQGLLGNDISLIGKRDVRKKNRYFFDGNVRAWSEGIAERAGKRKLSKVTSVLLWISSKEDVHAIIPGPRKNEQIHELLEFLCYVDRCKVDDTAGSSILPLAFVQELMGAGLYSFLDAGPVCE